MTFLKMLESIRTPFWDQVAAAVTLLGEETFFMLVGLALVWCFDKRWGFRLLFVGLTGTVLNQLLKAVFLIPRPWVIDPEFTIVETARAGATGTNILHAYVDGTNQIATVNRRHIDNVQVFVHHFLAVRQSIPCFQDSVESKFDTMSGSFGCICIHISQRTGSQ